MKTPSALVTGTAETTDGPWLARKVSVIVFPFSSSRTSPAGPTIRLPIKGVSGWVRRMP